MLAAGKSLVRDEAIRDPVAHGLLADLQDLGGRGDRQQPGARTPDRRVTAAVHPAYDGGVGAYVTGTEFDWPASVRTLNGRVNGYVVADCCGASICISVPVRYT
jgi:hypothetical protein